VICTLAKLKKCSALPKLALSAQTMKHSQLFFQCFQYLLQTFDPDPNQIEERLIFGNDWRDLTHHVIRFFFPFSIILKLEQSARTSLGLFIPLKLTVK
jgi:hypothetical protein